MIKLTLPEISGLYFSKILARLYMETSDGFGTTYRGYPKPLEPLIQVASGHRTILTTPAPVRRFEVRDTTRAVIGFSGGKDSLAAAIKMRGMGAEPVLFHVAGLNRAYPQEQVAVARLAALLDAEYVIFKIRNSGTTATAEHPLKNQLILSFMVDFGIKNGGIAVYANGNFLSEKAANSSRHFNFTDAIEMQAAANQFFSSCVDGYAGRDAILYAESESMKIVNEHLPAAFESLESCMTGLRYKANIRAANTRKFPKVPLLRGRCGSCYKCASEYLHLVSFGLYPEVEGYVNHCLNIMRAWVPKLSAEAPETVSLARAVSFFMVKDFVQIDWLTKYTETDASISSKR